MLLLCYLVGWPWQASSQEGEAVEDLTSQTGYVWDPVDVESTGNLIVIENFQNWTYDESVMPVWEPTDLNGNGIYGEYLGTMYFGDDMQDCLANATPGVPCYNMNTDGGGIAPVLRMSWGHGSVYQTVQIQQALMNQGYDAVGVTYSWEINNAWDDEAYARVYVYDKNGNLIYNSFYDYSYMATNGWLQESTTAYFSSAYPVENIGYAWYDWHGVDSASNLDSYYGPRWRNGSFEFLYVYNPCYVNPLNDPSCDGYAEAFAEQQYSLMCSADPLYDQGCPGYEDAYFNSMCNINPTYSLLCPNYPTSNEVFADQQIVDIVPIEVEEQLVEEVETEAEQEVVEEIAELADIEVEEVEVNIDPMADKNNAKEENISVSPEEKKEAKRKKVKEILVKKLKQLSDKLAEEANLEQQKILQEQIIALINYTPGFDAYKLGLPDAAFYVSENPYENLKVPENNRGLRIGLAQEVKHEQMVLSQYGG